MYMLKGGDEIVLQVCEYGIAKKLNYIVQPLFEVKYSLLPLINCNFATLKLNYRICNKQTRFQQLHKNV